MAPRVRYEADLASNALHADPAQRKAVEHFQMLYERLLAPEPAITYWRRYLGAGPRRPRGLYLWGGPGRGKTYLMDCFFQSLPFEEKRRVHFHRFMLEIHSALDSLPQTPDPLRIVATRLAKECRVLCLDEFHVSDIADAMLLRGLLEALLARGLVLVATSNSAPQGLYKDGLQRDRFEPVVALLRECMEICHLDGAQDFRMALLQHGGAWRLGEGEEAHHWLEQYSKELSPLKFVQDRTVRLSGRHFHARALSDGVVWFSFEELCMRPASTRDYIELAREFHTLLLEGIPCMGDEMNEAARRFIHLTDALYDHGVKLVATAHALPGNLYCGSRLEQMFRRTASRLIEMSSVRYLAMPHRPE